MTRREQLQAIDRIIRTIPYHGRRRPIARSGDAADCCAPAAAVDNHPPIGGIKGLREYQNLLDAHYERLRAEGERKPPPADPLAGLRDAVGFTEHRGDFTWLSACNR